MSSIIRRALLLALTICGVLALPAFASAASLTNSAGVLTYTGGAGQSDVNFYQGGGPNDVIVRDYYGFNGSDPIAAPAGCTLSTDSGSYRDYDCPGVTSIVASTGDDDDYVGSSVNLPLTADGGNGDDQLGGGGGNDSLNGGPGDDYLYGGGGDDDIRGGSGIDYSQINSSDPGGTGDGPSSSLTLDDQANDTGGNNGTDNIHSDVENVGSFTDQNTSATTPSAVATVIGDSASNSISVGGFAKGVLDGGAGNDSIAGGYYDDTINAVDGFADVVTCGHGTDSVTADQFDTVSDSCENVAVQQVGNANDDKQPSVTWTSPAENTLVPTTKPTTLTVNASDDKGVAKVQFLAGTRIVCEDTTAPYTCAYTPTGADSGKQVLTAVAIDTSQNASTALRAVRVARFTPKISEKLSPTKDTKAPYRFRVTGALTPPAGMSKAEACSSGKISTQVKAGSKTISTRRVDIKSNCTYSSTVTFRNRARFGKASKLKVTVRFTGNSVLASRTLTSKYVKIK